MISDQSNDISVFGSGKLLSDLINYVYNDKGCKLILIGDTAQLPPVGIDISPALDAKQLKKFDLEVIEHTLKQVVRQADNSGILFNATNLRNQIASGDSNFPALRTEYLADVIQINGTELIEAISDSYDKYGYEETIIITRSNKRANQYNQGIRNQILWREEEIAVGDFLMVVKNNYFWIDENEKLDFIANGDIGEIVQIKKYQEQYGFRFADIVLKLVDYDNLEIECKIILDTLDINTAALSSEENKKLFYNVMEDYQNEESRKSSTKVLRTMSFLMHYR